MYRHLRCEDDLCENMVLYESDGILVRPPIPTRFGTHQDVFTKTGEYAAQDGSGPDDVLTPRQRTWRDGTLEFSVLLLGSDKFPSVSHMLTETYPTARTLMEFSQQSALTHGSHAPLPDTTQKQPNYERDFAALGRGTDDLPHRLLQAFSEEIASDRPASVPGAAAPAEPTSDSSNQGELPQANHNQGEPRPTRKSLRRAARLAANVRLTNCKAPPRFGSHFIRNSPIPAFNAGHFDVPPSQFLPDITLHPGNAPPPIHKALQDPQWRAAIDAECNGILDSGSVMDCSYADVPPGTRPMKSHLILKEKPHAAPGKSKYKARLVIDGNHQFPAPSRADTYASTPSATAIRTLIALAAQDGHSLFKLDFTQAFLQSNLLSKNHQLYVIPPKHLRTGPDHLWKLLRAIYGVGMATQAWQSTLSDYLIATGWKPVCSENVYFVKNDGATQLRCVIHVDDILLSSPDPAPRVPRGPTRPEVGGVECRLNPTDFERRVPCIPSTQLDVATPRFALEKIKAQFSGRRSTTLYSGLLCIAPSSASLGIGTPLSLRWLASIIEKGNGFKDGLGRVSRRACAAILLQCLVPVRSG